MVIIDTEIYSDYFLLSALQLSTGKIKHFEAFSGQPLDRKAIASFMAQYTTISFNGISFDLPLIALALTGATPKHLKALADRIIKSNEPTSRILKAMEIRVPAWDHIDLIEVAPGQSSLKIYGGRLHAPKMQDLPIEPDASISPDEREIIKQYCINDLHTTRLLYETLKPAIELRASMGDQYGLDFRSKSDAQIAEALITHELSRMTGKQYRKPEIPEGFGFKLRDPKIIRFDTPELQEIYEDIMSERWTIGVNGSVAMPGWLKDQRIKIGHSEYQMGIGGLHSCETAQYLCAVHGKRLADFDVASYYPSIIMQQQLAPGALGKPFLDLYQSLITRRLEAKASGNKVVADTLKIALNGSFGKFGSKYSTLYAPELLIQTTITGQLALLMLIERLEAEDIWVVSANTDGIVTQYHELQEDDVERITWDWMLDTTYSLEKTVYSAIASRDVNNYVAVKPDGKIKGKGIFAPPSLAKNPDCQIVYTAVAQYIANDTPVEQTITECQDLTQFVIIRRVQGGAIWRGQKLGKAVRFYWSNEVHPCECIHYATNSNRVPKSAGARPVMDLPETFPSDVNYEAYITEARQLLKEVGA